MILIIVLIVIGLFLALKFYNKFKFPKLGALTLVSGGVKTGKSTFSVALAIKEYKSAKRSVKIANFFRTLFNRPLLEEPLLYSNVPLALPYVPITDKLIRREERFRYGSVIYIQEASLLADSTLIKDTALSFDILLWCKLIGHETKGGKVLLDTQTISDIHFGIRRNLSSYFYIHHLTKWLPGFLVAHIQEERYSEDTSVVNVNNGDVEDNLKRVLIPKSTWKYFDSYAYSVLTDNKPVNADVVKNNKFTTDLKARKIFSFRKEVNDLNEKENC